MESYQVTIQINGESKTFECPDNEYILDAADRNGINLPSSCRAGACSTCVGRIHQGTVDQRDQSFLDDDQLEAGFALLCVSYPTSDLEIEADVEEQIY